MKQKLRDSPEFHRSYTATSREGVKIVELDMVAASSRGDTCRWNSSAVVHRGYPTLKKDSLVHCVAEPMFSIVIEPL